MDAYDTNPEKTVVLPTAPSSVRGGMNVDIERIPVNGPYKVFVANVAYDADEDMISAMFKGLDVLSVHLPSDESGRFKGFGYVEFGNRDDLIEALEMDDLEVAGRKLRIDLKTPNERDQQRGYSSFGRDEDRERAEDDDDWRSGPRTAPARTNNDWRGGAGGGERDGERGGDSDWRSGPGGGPSGGDRGGDRGGGSDWRSGPGGGPSGGDSRGDNDWRSGPRSDVGGDRNRGGYGGFGGGRDREPTMASKPGSKYEAVPSFSDYGRGGGGGGGFGSDRRSDDRYGGGRDDRYGDRDRGGGYGSDRRGDDRYGSRDDRYGDRDRGGGYGSDRRGDDRYGSRDDRYGDRDRGGGGGGGGGGGFERRGDGGDRGRDDRFGSRDAPRSEGRDGPRPGSDDRPPGDGDRPAAERPKLNLKPRSVPADEAGKPAASSSIFGGAKPVDTTAREREVEERLKSTRIDERPRPAEPGPGSQRRAEASRDIRLTEPARSRDESADDSSRSGETNGKATHGGERRERPPRPPKTLDEKPAVFAEESRFSALPEDDDA